MASYIENKTYDYYNTNTNDPNMPYPIFLYWLADDLIDEHKSNLIPLTHTDKIVSINYAPYLNSNELMLDKIMYDVDRFRLKSDKSQHNLDVSIKPYVFRIRKLYNQDTNKPGIINKRLGTFKCYKSERPTDNKRNHLNESKLYNYPYRYAYLFDGIIQPIQVKYHLCVDNEVEVWSRSALTINADYSLYMRNYKNDYDGFLEQSINNSNKELPSISNQYIAWLSTNKNQLQNRVASNTAQSTLSGIVSGAATGGFAGAISQGLVGAITSYMPATLAQRARNDDMKNTPNALVSAGGDFLLQMHTSGKELKLIRYKQNEEWLEKIGDFMAMFGYKQEKLLDVKSLIKTRYYYNYIKTTGVNIQGNGIPKEHLNELRAIYDRGTTIWHMSNSGVKMHDYSLDNKEVYK